MIDIAQFKENFSYLDDDIVVEIIDIFLGEYDERFTALQQNISDLDFAGLKFNAHSLKGVISNFMDPVTIALSKKLDEKAKEGDSTGLQELFDELKSAADTLKAELIAIKATFK